MTYYINVYSFNGVQMYGSKHRTRFSAEASGAGRSIALLVVRMK